ncbi:MAG: helix-turn-helix domain-containing protein [bacterium]|nr:helix-turn-helix domain-containing protein [bacterium]MDI1335882.1 helix-turn-helix domain-containing protein [Lacunisphaera sp.]
MLALKSLPEIAAELAGRIRARRLRRGWTQAEMARRAGIKEATYVLFERTGRISLLRLLKVLELLGLVDEIDRVGRQDDLTGLTLADVVQPERQRGRRQKT